MKEILVAVVVCSGFWTVVNTVVMYYITKAQKRDESQQISKTEYDALCKGVRGLLYGELERRCTEYIEHGEISAGELNDLRKYYYDPYRALDGDGTIESLFHRVEGLKLIK